MKIPIGKLKLRLTSGIILLALALHFFIAISLPFIQVFDMVATSFDSTNTKQDVAIGSFPKLTQIRLGIWGACYYSQNNSACSTPGSAYSVAITQNKSRIIVVETSWTGGLPIQVFAGGFTLVALVLTQFFLHDYRLATLIAVGLAGGTSWLALFIELGLFLLVKGKMQTLEAGATTSPGPGFWMTLICAVLLSSVFLWIFFKDKFSRIDKKKDKKENQLPEEYQVDPTAKVTPGQHSDTFKFPLQQRRFQPLPVAQPQVQTLPQQTLPQQIQTPPPSQQFQTQQFQTQQFQTLPSQQFQSQAPSPSQQLQSHHCQSQPQGLPQGAQRLHSVHWQTHHPQGFLQAPQAQHPQGLQPESHPSSQGSGQVHATVQQPPPPYAISQPGQLTGNPAAHPVFH